MRRVHLGLLHEFQQVVWELRGQVHAALGALEPRIFGCRKQHEIVIALIGDNDGLAARALAHVSNGAVEFLG